MRKMLALLVTAFLLMPLAALAENELRLDGQIEASREVTLLAPYSGVVGDFVARAGDPMAAGEAVLTIATTGVYAEFDGKVTGLFAKPGDAAASIQGRYGALCYLEREVLYSADCTTSGAGSDNDNKIVHVGEEVYLRSMNSNNRTGEAVVVGVSGKSYRLEVTKAGNLRLSDQVRVYRDRFYASEDCIGTGRLSRVEPEAVTAEGSVLAVHVSDGQYVARGDLMFETVPDALDGLRGGDGSVYMPQDGVLLRVQAQAGATVKKDEMLVTYCPADEVRLVCAVDEEDLAQISVGDPMRVVLDALPDKPMPGKVISIAGASVDNGKTFEVIITLDTPNAQARIGMNATAFQVE